MKLYFKHSKTKTVSFYYCYIFSVFASRFIFKKSYLNISNIFNEAIVKASFLKKEAKNIFNSTKESQVKDWTKLETVLKTVTRIHYQSS